MRLVSFEVRGFKNIVAPVRLDDLGPINILHGENNVGKSNVLHAMEVFFSFLEFAGEQGAWVPVVKPVPIHRDVLNRARIRSDDLFNYAVPNPIQMTAKLAIAAEELERGGIAPLLDVSTITIVMAITRLGEAVLLQLPSFRFGDGTDIAHEQPTAERKQFVMRFAAFLTGRFLGKQRMHRVDVDRHLDTVVDALYDAHVSVDRAQAKQWERFAEAMSGFQDILGDGRFLVVLPRSPDAKPQLLFETPSMRVPFHALGSGVQEMVAVLGSILTSGASVVFLEEPEVHLRWALQERVRDVLVGLVGKDGAPSQLVVTSHSGAFETGPFFYLMQRGDPGPTLERRPIAQAPLVVGGPVADVAGKAPAVPAHVSAEGILRLPERIRKAIGVEEGGGVSFVDKGEGIVEVMTDDTFLKLAGPDDA